MGVLLAEPAQAQDQFDVAGVIADSTGARLDGAMVVALVRQDSVLTQFALTGGNGAFRLRRLSPGEYILQVSLVGYQTVRQDFSVSNADVDAGTVSLDVLALEVDPLVVSVEQIPFVTRRDTLDYNILAFPTRPNASVEELLRRLPGIEVESDGSIRAQGQDVENVLVDGKEFFASDPKIATQNLPADAIERVQVYERKSDMAEFTGISDGDEETTINLVLKEGAKGGYFGNATGGLGADVSAYEARRHDESLRLDLARYDGAFNINRFSSTTQLAAVANLNNVNARAPGFTETFNLGLNANHDFAARSWIRSSYSLGNSDNLLNSTLQQQQLLGSQVSSLIDQTSSQTIDDLTHNLNVNAQHTFADGHDLRLRANLNAGSSALNNANFRETQTASGLTQNTAATSYVVDEDNIGGDARLTWRKRISESGRSIVAEGSANLNEPDMAGLLSSTTGLYSPPGGTVTYNEILQQQSRFGRTLRHSLRLSLTEPLGPGRVLEIFGQRNVIAEDQTKSVYDLESGTLIFNNPLSSEFETTYTYLLGGLRFNRNTPDKRFMLGLQVQNSNLDNNVLDQDVQFTNGYTHLLPSANFRVQFDQGESLDLRYTTSTREPAMTELQPYVTNTDPLNVYVGNPTLTPEYTHALNTEYRLFDQFSFLNLFTFLRGTYTKDDIVMSRTVDAQARQVTTPVNAARGWSTTGGANLGTPIRRIGARLSLEYNVTYSKGYEFVNSAENVARLLQNTIVVGLENRDKDVFDIRAGGRFTFNDVDYSLNDELNTDYLNRVFYGSGTYYLGPWTFSTSMDYQMYDQEVFGAGQNVALLGASVSRLVMEDRVEVQLIGFDLLNQNQGVSITSTSSFIQEERTESLSQYLMLKLIYRLGPSGVAMNVDR
jgi:hypothetical protein